MSDVPWLARLCFVDGFLENLANADSENTEMRKADSTVWTAEGLPDSHIPCHCPPPPPAQFSHIHCYCLESPCVYICLGMSLSLKEIEHGLCFSSHSQWAFFQLHILVICGGMMLKLMKANAHLNTKDRVFMPPFGTSFMHLNFLHHYRWFLLQRNQTHKKIHIEKHDWGGNLQN